MGKRALEGNLGYKGERGYSAYEIAVLNGYEGTEQEWIDHFGLDLTGYLKTTDVIDDLEHEYTTRPLSAKQGKQLETDINYVETIKVDKADFVVINATITLENGTTGNTLQIDYPTGYTKDNCVVISTMSNYTAALDGFYNYNYESIQFDSTYPNYIPKVRLTNSKINIKMAKDSSVSGDESFHVKIVLMKISAIQSL